MVAAKPSPALGQETFRRISVIASQCSSGVCKTVERMMPERYNYSSCCAAPCCLVPPPTPYTPEPFTWPRPDDQDAPENTVSALKWLEENLVPEGVVVLPVQGVPWLDRTVDFSPTTSITIESSKTGYIFVKEATWTDCQVQFGATVEGHELRVANGCAFNALEFMLPGIVGIYTATANTVTAGVLKLRAQALLQYLAVNDMLGWPTRGAAEPAGDGGEQEGEGSNRSDSSSASSDSDGADGDEGLMEARMDNISAQRYISVLSVPEVYEGLGFSAPPTSFTPPTREQYFDSFGSGWAPRRAAGARP
ncbi:hypothetical protein GPECTOR_10g1137 [Gonium pectorale]|uniref:Uncharacterized protein n=1 Tax=Gonium pectorale TaxID=33097 RepID=A0A150GQP6_GONPE|nr:hypothetical protein GPECTOR_10g1137 [Gonium pectorale]|eukprot:KXZ52114.1 hypothetical protein GPECTOR_10g1137 [Gonium pectorale]